jgi:plasmid stabilization system protein ParE
MSRTVRILAQAKSDIEQIFAWIESRSPKGAAAWYRTLFDAVEKIAAVPEGYPLITESTPRWNRKLHQALFKTARGNRYRAVFELTDVEIRILRIRGPGQPPLRRRDIPAV